MSKKNYLRTTLVIPLIAFYIEKIFTRDSFIEIAKLKKDMRLLNPNSILFCITESVSKKLLPFYKEYEDDIYILRGNYAHEPHKDFVPEVFQLIYDKLVNFAENELPTFDQTIPFGHKDLIKKPVEVKEEVEGDGNEQ